MTASKDDPVSPELRKVEVEIDGYHQRNPLIHLPFGTSAWCFMAFCEDMAAMDVMKGNRATVYDSAVFADAFVTHLKNPFHWLYSCCPLNGEPACSYDEHYYQAAWDLSNLAERYEPFEGAFTYASRGLVELSLEERIIVPSKEFRMETRYEAYDRLVKPHALPPDFEPTEFVELLQPQVHVEGEFFRYRLTPRLVARSRSCLEPLLLQSYSLPNSWEFPRYSIKDFRQIAGCLVTIAYIHFLARLTAAQLGCVGLGYASSVFLATERELIARLTRYSGCSRDVVERLLLDMTYGSKSTGRPDPALQPLVKLNDKWYALMPSLVLNSSMERNFTVLLNRIPSERAAYLGIVKEKEAIMRQRMIDALEVPGIRHFSGIIPSATGLPDIDLALIDDAERTCIFLELKWFIEPADPREVIEKSEEIMKGIAQLLKLSAALNQDAQLFFETLDVDSTYKFAFVVVSENSIGMSFVQDPRIPVVRQTHFTRKLNSLKSLRIASDWLSRREYLPVEDRDYEIVEKTWTVGKWGIQWYGLKPLIEDEYL